jgi:hypothetical protein
MATAKTIRVAVFVLRLGIPVSLLKDEPRNLKMVGRA